MSDTSALWLDRQMAPERASPIEVLATARSAARNGDYPLALDRFEWFFDHALEEDPASFYGVRLSYCVSEWARVGQTYPPALRRLRERQQDALRLLDETRNPNASMTIEQSPTRLAILTLL